MNFKPYYVVSKHGGFHLGVNSLEEAVFAATGDYAFINDIGYPTVIGAFVESELDITPYNSYSLPRSWKHATSEILEGLLEDMLTIYKHNDGILVDVTYEAQNHLKEIISDLESEEDCE